MKYIYCIVILLILSSFSYSSEKITDAPHFHFDYSNNSSQKGPLQKSLILRNQAIIFMTIGSSILMYSIPFGIILSNYENFSAVEEYNFMYFAVPISVSLFTAAFIFITVSVILFIMNYLLYQKSKKQTSPMTFLTYKNNDKICLALRLSIKKY